MSKTRTHLKPVGNRVLAKRLEQEESMKGGILLPDTAKQKQEKVQIIALGTPQKTEKGEVLPFPVEVGDIILMDKYAGQEVFVDDEEFIILKAEDIVAIVTQ